MSVLSIIILLLSYDRSVTLNVAMLYTLTQDDA